MSTRTLGLDDRTRDWLLQHGVRERASLARLRDETAALPEARMQICPEQGAFMALLVQLMGVRRALEVGTFTGYSSLCIAGALPPDGRLVCCDASETWTAVARRYWAEEGLDARIELRLGNALDTLDGLVREGQRFDLAFVDADKENLLAYHERCLALVRPGGAILYDNALWSGSVADPTDERESTNAVRGLARRLRDDERVDIALLPVGDGLFVCRVR